MSSKILKRHVLFQPGLEVSGSKSYYLMLKRAVSLEKRYHGYDVKSSKLFQLENGNNAVKLTWNDEQGKTETTYEFQDHCHLIEPIFKEHYLIKILRIMRMAIFATLDLYVPRLIYKLFKGRHGAKGAWVVYMVHYPVLGIAIAAWLAWLGAEGLSSIMVSYFPPPAELDTIITIVMVALIFHLINLLYLKFDDVLFIYSIGMYYTFRFEVLSGRKPEFDAVIVGHAERLKELMETSDADEIVVASHCQGGMWAIRMVAEYFRSEQAKENPSERKVNLITMGVANWVPWYGFAKQEKQDLQIVCFDERLFWVEVFAPQDVTVIQTLHPYEVVSQSSIETVPNPIRISARWKEALSTKTIENVRFHVFKIHFLYMNANETGKGVDYYKMIASGKPVESHISKDLITKRQANFKLLKNE